MQHNDLSIDFSLLHVDEQNIPLVRNAIKTFAKCQNQPLTHKELQNYLQLVKPGNKSNVKDLINQWNAIADTLHVGIKHLDETYGCQIINKYHRVCKKKAGQGQGKKVLSYIDTTQFDIFSKNVPPALQKKNRENRKLKGKQKLFTEP